MFDLRLVCYGKEKSRITKMTKKKQSANKWYLLYNLVPILFVIGTAITLQVHPIKDPSIMIYGVKSTEHEEATGFKFTKMTLTDGRVIDRSTMADIREQKMLTYHNQDELNHAYSFSKSMLN